MSGKMIVPVPGHGFAVYCKQSNTFETVLGQQVWLTAVALEEAFEAEQERYRTAWRETLGDHLFWMAAEAGF